MTSHQYIHGYSGRETQRLFEQSEILETLLHTGTSYKLGEKVLEAGCGVGAQSRILCRRNPEAAFTSVDISPASVEAAQENAKAEKLQNIAVQQADIMHLPFGDHTFDHVFVCFVLEHLAYPHQALTELKRVLKTGGSLTVIEGDHGSCTWHPETEASVKTWNASIHAQLSLKHNPLIGRQLYPLLSGSGFQVDDCSPKSIYTDGGNPGLMHDVSSKIIVPMTETAKNWVITNGLLSENEWNKGMADLLRIGIDPSCTFFYTWYKAIARKKTEQD